ncbi:hypothetical protein [Arthrobacter sp. BF1]|uniref:hypothetical protein n=1 Tax=Arthrobacter sp. BF1 TaxID=2821145 RepID=UPI001C4EFC79|nr:hypothetical protein [Arthrobacter sp. BF1]
MAGAPHPAAVTITYTKFSRPQSLTTVSRMQGMDIGDTLDFSTEGGQTRLAWSWMLHTRGFLRWISPVIRAVGKHQERNNWAELRHYL